ncbi:MAG: D-alanyl-D-alanine carboxypeptidase [Holosporaceae bacterium]|jgi:D-alanyl-D-alanine carboxypeptidase (penicillin-binding protein 5/6)|nr:D-alanyl-D-alanine carboxypeptidase [Holosporaceae bacterium]
MKRIIIFLAVVLLSAVEAVSPDKKTKTNQLISAKQAILIDHETGECLFEKCADEECVPSSMTKLMTLYLLFSAISSNRIKLDDEFPVSEIAQKMKGSRSFFQAGTLAKVEDLIRSIVVHSGNDACVIVAEGLSGDIETFAEEMNEKGKEFGLRNTNFVNPTGMPDEEHFSSVRDLATISRRIISDFPQFYHYFSEKTFTINSITQQNRNNLLGNSLKVDGLKTGKTNSGGYGIAASAASEGKRLIAVINGCKTSKARAKDANKLLALGFREFTPFKIAEAGKQIAEISVWLGVKDKIGLCPHEDVTVLMPKKYRKLLKVEVKFKEPIEAPIALGTKLGELVYKYGTVTSQKYDLFAQESVGRADFFQRAKLSLKHLIFGDGDIKQAVKSTIGVTKSASEAP